MALAKHGFDLALRFLNEIRRGGRDLDHVEFCFARQSLHDRAVWRDDRVVLILSHHVAALALEDAVDFERYILDAHDLTDSAAVWKEVLGDGCA